MLLLPPCQIEVFELSNEWSVCTHIPWIPLKNNGTYFPLTFFSRGITLYTDILPALQQKYSERSPRPFVNLSPPLLKQILHSTSVFSIERWFPRGFKVFGLVQTTFSLQSNTGQDQQISAFIFYFIFLFFNKEESSCR